MIYQALYELAEREELIARLEVALDRTGRLVLRFEECAPLIEIAVEIAYAERS